MKLSWEQVPKLISSEFVAFGFEWFTCSNSLHALVVAFPACSLSSIRRKAPNLGDPGAYILPHYLAVNNMAACRSER